MLIALLGLLSCRAPSDHTFGSDVDNMVGLWHQATEASADDLLGDCAVLSSTGQAWARIPESVGPLDWSAAGPHTVDLYWGGLQVGSIELEHLGDYTWAADYEGMLYDGESAILEPGCEHFAAEGKLPDVVQHAGPVDVAICRGAPVSRRQVKRALRWWQQRCVVDEIGDVYITDYCPEVGPLIYAQANTIYILAAEPPNPAHAGSTITLGGPASGWVSLIRLRHSRSGFSRLHRWPQGRRLLIHELGHALAFDHHELHHGPPGSPMSGNLDDWGRDDWSVDLCE